MTASGDFVIRFDFDDVAVVWYAGWTGGGTLGYAPSIATAARFDSVAVARRTLDNSYGPESRACGSIRSAHREGAAT